MKRFIGYFLIAILGGSVSLGLYKAFESKLVILDRKPAGIPVRQVAYNPVVSMNLPDFEAAAAASINAVVHVKSEFQKKSLVYDDFFEFFNFGNPTPREYISPYTSMGSGVIISPDGYIVTNNHMVQEAHEVTVTLNDKRAFPATIVGTDPSTDLALLKIEATDLPFLGYGNSDDLKIGEWVLAVGNPFNLTSTVTAGIVSAKARNINILGSQGAIASFIQTDAAINPGNSGGALVNTRGELVGINAAIASGTGYYTGYSFAIPVNFARKVVDDFLKYGKIQRAYLGIYYREVDEQLAKDKKLPDLRGVYIDDVVEGGAAEKAGIQKGDVIVKINEHMINGKSELMEVIGQHNPGDKIAVTISRNGTDINVPLTFLSENEDKGMIRENRIIIHGATFEPITDAEKSKFRISSGFKITRLENGKLKNAGIRPGFILISVDRKVIGTAQELKDALTSRDGGVLIEGIYPNGLRAY